MLKNNHDLFLRFHSKPFLFIAAILFLLKYPLMAQELAKGVLIEKVVCRQNPDHSYALYLPGNYDPAKSWPVLYCFDPGARGRLAVELFQPLDEELGVIIIGSNNSRNGPMDVSVLSILWEDSHSRLNIRQNAVFCTGMSGGVHVAFSVAATKPSDVAGVIACCNDLPPWLSPDEIGQKTAVYLLTGITDFNNQRTKNLVKKLSPLGIWSHADIFPGTHEYPPAIYAGIALKALLLQTMKRGAIEKNESLIDRFFGEQQQTARNAENSADDVTAYLTWLRIEKVFAGLRDIKESSAKVATLSQLPKTIAYLKQEAKTDSQETFMRNKIFRIYNRLFQSENLFEEIQDMNIDYLRKLSLDTDLTPNVIAAKRVLSELNIAAHDSGNSEYLKKNWPAAKIAFDITHRINPDSWRPYFNLACVAIAGNEKKNAMKMLKAAIDKGLEDQAFLQIPEFDPIRQEKDFLELLQKLAKK